jgi:hypothetical protein
MEVSIPKTTKLRESRIEAGERLARERGDEFIRTGEHTFRIPSCSSNRKGTYYDVDIQKNGCTCKDRQRSRRICKHLWAGATYAFEMPSYRVEQRGTTYYGDPSYSVIETRAGFERVVSVRPSYIDAVLDRLDIEAGRVSA